MRPLHLFPPADPEQGPVRAVEWDPHATYAEFSDAEIEQMRRVLVAGETPTCPHCDTGFSVERLDPGVDDEVVWKLECGGCAGNLAVRAHPRSAPRPPAFDTLILSRPQRTRSRAVPQTLFSLALHTALIGLAIIATQRGVEVLEAAQDTAMVFLVVDAEKEPEPEPEDQPVRASQIVTLAAPAKGFQTVTAPVDIPTEIPPIDLSQRFDPRDYSGVGVEGGVFAGVEGGTETVDETYLTHTFTEAAVDEPPERLTGPPLVYPEILRQAGIEGTVTLEFVVDTAGRVEAETIAIIFSANVGFNEPARSLIRGSVYRPGRVRGRAVRVLVQQSINFDILRD